MKVAIRWCDDRARNLPYLRWFVVRMGPKEYAVFGEGHMKRHPGMDVVYERTGTDKERREFDARFAS